MSVIITLVGCSGISANLWATGDIEIDNRLVINAPNSYRLHAKCNCRFKPMAPMRKLPCMLIIVSESALVGLSKTKRFKLALHIKIEL